MATNLNKNKITILMANYNNNAYLKVAIESVINQSSSNWKLLIIDDNSKDNSLEIIKPYLNDKRIKLIVNEKNLGYIGTLKKMIKLAENDLVAIVDSDDALTPDAVETVLKYYNNNPEAKFIYSKFIYCDKNLKSTGKISGEEIPVGKSNLSKSYSSHFKTFTKNIYQECGGYDDSMIYAEDKDLIFKIEEVTKLHFIDKPLYLYRILPNSQSHDSVKSIISKINYTRAKLNAYHRRLKNDIPNISQKQLSYELFYASALYFKLKQIKNSLRFFLKAIFLYPFNFRGYKIFFLITAKCLLTMNFVKTK
jgi:glycosyltransferase involved in cell wall biosynthesis